MLDEPKGGLANRVEQWWLQHIEAMQNQHRLDLGAMAKGIRNLRLSDYYATQFMLQNAQTLFDASLVQPDHYAPLWDILALLAKTTWNYQGEEL